MEGKDDMITEFKAQWMNTKHVDYLFPGVCTHVHITQTTGACQM